MTDENKVENGSATGADDAAAAELEQSTALLEGSEEEAKERIDLAVDITDVGPCQKHLRVTVPRSEIDRFFNKEFGDLVRSANVPGFRPGKTPRKLIERRFRKDVADQVKANLLLQSLEQIGEEKKIEPLTEPNIDIKSIVLPDEGDFVYEFDVEVPPDFETPNYKAMEIERPTREFTPEDIENELQRYLKSIGKLETKEGAAEVGDTVVCDVRFTLDGQVLNEASDIRVRIDETLFFRDGRIEKFGEQMVGVKAGDSRDMKAILSDNVREELHGKTVDATVVVKEVLRLIVPSMNEELFERTRVSDEGEFRDLIEERLKRRLQFKQRETARHQVLSKIVEAANWELPPKLLARQATRLLQRRVLEMQQGGFGDEDIRKRLNVIQQDSRANAGMMLKQQFVLQKIAEAEDIKVDEDDLEDALREIAASTGEGLRRVRARVDKDGLWESVALQVLEQKTIDKIISYATVKEVPYVDETVKGSAVDEAAAGSAEEAETGADEAPAAE